MKKIFVSGTVTSVRVEIKGEDRVIQTQIVPTKKLRDIQQKQEQIPQTEEEDKYIPNL